MMAHVAPLQIGPYQIFEEIGRGGMSIVYRARDTRDDRIVALKVLPPELHHQRHLLSRFVKEGQSTLRLVHPNIVRTFEADFVNETSYMAMELVQGENLSEYLKRHQGPLPFDDVMRILRQIADGLDYAHAQGILHRDIKPSNILLNYDGRALITDFGVARDLSGDHTLVTVPGHSVGTPAYMSPEQARGEQNVDSRSDIYSLGVVAYAMLTGTMPFEAPSQLALLRKIIDDSPTPPEQINPQLSPNVARTLKSVLAKDPHARYATAEQFVTALEVGIAEGTLATREPNSDETMPDIVVGVSAASSVDAPTVGDSQISTPRRKGNPLLIAAERARRRNVNASSKSKPIPREFLLKTSGAQAGKGRRTIAYLVGGALLIVVLLAAFALRDWITPERQSEDMGVALVASPQSDASTPLPPTPTPEATTNSENVGASGTGSNDSAAISESVGVPTSTQVAQEESDSNQADEPALASATAVAHVIPAPAFSATPTLPPTSTPVETSPTPLPTSTPASTPTVATTSVSEPTPSPQLDGIANAAANPSSAGGLTDATSTATVRATSVATDAPEPTSTSTIPTAIPTITPSPLPSVAPTTKPISTVTPVPANTPADEALVPGATKVNEIDGAIFVYVPGGKFSMGSTRADDEKPLHAVEIDAFWIMQTEVTNAQYALCVADGVCSPPLNDRMDDPTFANHPVTNIDWFQANEYAEWSGGRLPTEAEWEKAARGNDQRPFPWGEDAPDETLLNFDSIVNDTTPVANYPLGASPYGLYDMAGNVEEWVGDWYASDYYAASLAQNPVGPADGIFRVVRGGSYHSEAMLVLATTRGKAAPDRGYSSVGFRVVLDE